MSELTRGSHREIHPDYGKLLVTDYILLAYNIIWILVFELPRFLINRLWLLSNPSYPPFSISLKYFFIRTYNHLIQLLIPFKFCLISDFHHHRTNILFNHRQIRFLIQPFASTILSSHRYCLTSHNLYHRISGHGFVGYWIIRSSFTDPQPPRESDVMIYFLHGGGYFASQPDTYLLFLLRLAEAILAQDLTVSIFALDYHLAPEFPYPTQLNEAIAAYEYLVHEMEIPTERIVVAGDSAGGHLVLSMLVKLHQSSSLPKPGGAMLFSPWLSLHQTPSMTAEMDVLSASSLRATARRFLGPDQADKEIAKTNPLLEFLDPTPETEWDAVLPSWVWITAGSNEVLFNDIEKWTVKLEKQLGKERVSREWGEKEVHDWQWLETMDEEAKARFLEKRGKCEDFKAVMKIGKIVKKNKLK